ncbi:MAG: hypothetical protein WC676_07030 [Candidatus Omnitrophota bacterium]
MNKKSFTIIELLITIVVAVLVVTGVLMSLINSMVLDEHTAQLSIGMNIARAKIEEVLSRRSDFDNIVSVPSGNDQSGVKLTADGDGMVGAYRIIVRGVTGFASELKTVKVAVCWKGRGNRVVGDCRIVDDGTVEWISLADLNPKSGCELETAIAKR